MRGRREYKGEKPDLITFKHQRKNKVRNPYLGDWKAFKCTFFSTIKLIKVNMMIVVVVEVVVAVDIVVVVVITQQRSSIS